jgi:peptidoglycan/LPS O-acetylase OafA/YrhL
MRNNFDLIRLVAAAQVMVKHALVHLGFESHWLTALLSLFPGVPVFFFVSGYLIFQSFHNSRSLRQFALNRVLRIYPALAICFVFALGLVLASGYLAPVRLAQRDFAAWAIAQLTLLQIYNWEALRGFGVGALNGSLWTVAVELQFYLLTPLLAWAATRGGERAWALLLAVGVGANLLMQPDAQSFGPKLYTVSFPPWLYMFMLGAWLSTRPQWQARLLRAPVWALLGAYVVIGLAGSAVGWRVTGNEINPLSYVLLAALIYRLAFTQPDLSSRLLGHNDVSYGVYIYHMPIINLLIYLGRANSAGQVMLACTATAVMAVLSWILVERPALRLKRLALRKL